MTEHYPSDADLNAMSGTLDSEQEVLYVATGESPYFTSFYKMLYRMLDVARRAGDFRVYKDGDLTFGVRAGRIANGTYQLDYQGDTQQPLADNATTHIYLDANASIQTTTGTMPLPTAVPHLPLASITTANGGYTLADITDLRGAGMYRLLDGISPAMLQDKLPTCLLTCDKLSASQWSIAFATYDAGGNALPGQSLVRLWVSTTTYGAPQATGNTLAVTSGTLHTIVAANADYLLITGANGTLGLTLTATAGVRAIMAEIDGRIYTTGLMDFA